MAQVLIEGITKIYPGNVKAVDNITLGIEDREFIVLVGPSGCGKSTTLRMVAGLEEITDGTIRIGDRVVNDVPPKDRDIAMVFQNYALYPHMTVYKNMAFGLKLRKVPKKEIDQKVRSAAKLLGIEELLSRKPKALSGGQRQRVAVGRAIVRNPEAFLFDEPLSNLDAKLRVETRAELKRLHMELQTTTIYVTHDQEEAMTLGDRIVVMEDGIIQQCAPPLEVYERPTNRFVAGFVGMPPMNFFDGKIIRSGELLQFDEGSNRLDIPARLRQRLEPYVDQEIVMGIRPENFSDQMNGQVTGETNGKMRVTVRVIEPLGEKMDVYAATPNHDYIVCRIDAHAQMHVGNEVDVYVDTERTHFFQPGKTGKNISLVADKDMPDGMAIKEPARA